MHCLITRAFSFSAILATVTSLLCFDTGLAGENYAFLVAVQDYDVKDFKPLQYTRNDIEKFAKLLGTAGFKPENVVVLTDRSGKPRYLAEAEKIRNELNLLLDGLEEGDTLIVAFSGHGIQFEGEEKNYYCPLDTDLEDPKRTKLIPLSEIYDKLKQCPAEKKLLLVDACRNDPLSNIKKSRDTVKLKSVTRPQTEPVPKGVVALFSCAAGQQSYEWPDLKHGVFFHHVLEGWKGAADDGDKQITLDEVVTYSRQKTQSFARLTLKANQTPQLKSDFSGTWVLAMAGAGTGKKPHLDLGGGVTLQLVDIPAGEFDMGSSPQDVARVLQLDSTAKKEYFDDEQPRHRVRITRPFSMAKYEVTIGQFKRFVADMNYKTEAETDGKGGWGYDNSASKFEQNATYHWKNTGWTQTDDHPVVNVTWNDAVKFCEWLTRKEGRTCRLPTEAEWEYACRAGTSTLYSCGHDFDSLSGFANIADQSAKRSPGYSQSLPFAVFDDGYQFTAPVGKFKPNSFGLHDMHGNVWEWCQDWYDEKYYGRAPVGDPEGAVTGTRRVLRGGSWNFRSSDARSADRFGVTPVNRNYVYVGFRVVCAR